MDWQLLHENLPELLRASVVTVELTILTLVLSTVLALPLAILRSLPGRIVPRLIAGYSLLMRALPTLVVLFLVYYGLPSAGIRLPAFSTAAVGLILSATAYNLEIFRAGFATVDRGQMDAARALGVPAPLMWLRVVVPQALPTIMPPYISNATLILKGTSVASIITVTELTATANAIVSMTYRPMEILIGTALIYLLLSSVLTSLQSASARLWPAR